MTRIPLRAVIREDAEKQLIEMAQVCRRMNLPLRCVHFRFSGTPPLKTENPEVVSTAIADGIEDPEAMLYQCRDGDLFLVSRLATQKSILRILSLLPQALVPATDLGQGLVHLFELNLEYQYLLDACKTKLDSYAAAEASRLAKIEADKKAEEIRTQRDVDLDIALNAQFIASLPSRRMERRTPAVLFVEDDIFSQRLLGNALRNKFEVYTAGTGREGLVSYIRQAPDIVFLDINLPDISGLEALCEILNIDHHAHVVMLSGNGSRDNVLKAVRSGAKGFVGKPFTLDKLEHYIGECTFITDKINNREIINA